MAGWTEKDIDLEDPEAYHGGQIVTAGIKARELEKKRKAAAKKRLEEQRAMIAQLRNKREPMKTF